MASAIIAASVSLIVAILTPVLTSWRARRQAVVDLFDSAVGALLVAQTTRLYPSNGPHFQTVSWSEDETRQYLTRLQQRGIDRWLETQEDARLALARLEPFVPELRNIISDKWEITSEQEPHLRWLLEARRRDAVKSERLLRVRRSPRPLHKVAPRLQ